MKQFFWRLSGICKVTLTSADLGSAITFYTQQGVHLINPRRTDQLMLECMVHRNQLSQLCVLAEKRGDDVQTKGERGTLFQLKRFRSRLGLAAALTLLFVFALWASGRIWFIQVDGNSRVLSQEILQAAQQCGIKFWAKSDEVRNEAVKNQMLNLLPQLQWVGINFSGGIVTISVSERLDEQEVRPTDQITNVVAARNGIVVSMSVLGGQPVCQIGQAVTEGELLVSGCVEHEYQPQYTCADAEIYALTQHKIEAIYPGVEKKTTAVPEKSHGLKLILGKEKIKIFGNSGISGASCDKMTRVHTLTLPGGFELPVSLVWETYSSRNTVPACEEDAASIVSENCMERETYQQMTAGEILGSSLSAQEQEGSYRFQCVYSCREMISRQRKVLFFEGENADDGKNRERGESGRPH